MTNFIITEAETLRKVAAVIEPAQIVTSTAVETAVETNMATDETFKTSTAEETTVETNMADNKTVETSTAAETKMVVKALTTTAENAATLVKQTGN